MNIIKKWNMKKHIFLSLIIVSVYVLIDTYLNSCRYNKSIEAIGEVDGPVATFTTNNVQGFNVLRFIINKYTVVFVIIMLLYKPLMLLIGKVVKED